VRDSRESILAKARLDRSLSDEIGIRTKIAMAVLAMALNSIEATKVASIPQFWQK